MANGVDAATSRLLKQKFRLPTGKVRPDLAGSYGIGRRRDWSAIEIERILAERIGFFINGVLRRVSPGIKDRLIRERLSAPWKFTRGEGYKRGRLELVPNPVSAGLRKRSGKLQRSIRITVTSPGTTGRGFRGVFRLSSKIGGGDVQYAHRHENEGLLQFGRVTSEEYSKVVSEITKGVTVIVAEFGGTVN